MTGPSDRASSATKKKKRVPTSKVAAMKLQRPGIAGWLRSMMPLTTVEEAEEDEDQEFGRKDDGFKPPKAEEKVAEEEEAAVTSPVTLVRSLPSAKLIRPSFSTRRAVR